MELNHLKYFYFVAKEGGFSKASRALKIAQPAITKTVQKLEAELDVQLFDRIGKTVRLTKSGNDLFRKCEIIFAQVDEIRSLHQKSRDQVRGSLCIAAAEPIANHIVPPIVAKLLEVHPQLYIQVITGTATEMARLVAAGKVDIGLFFHMPDQVGDLEILKTYPVPFMLVAAASKKDDPEVCARFIGSREVDDVGNNKYPTLKKLQKIYPKAEIKLSANSLSSHLTFVLAGIGVSILPEFMVRKDLAAKRLAILLDNESFKFNLKVVTRRSAPLSAAANAFLGHLTI